MLSSGTSEGGSAGFHTLGGGEAGRDRQAGPPGDGGPGPCPEAFESLQGWRLRWATCASALSQPAPPGRRDSPRSERPSWGLRFSHGHRWEELGLLAPWAALPTASGGPPVPSRPAARAVLPPAHPGGSRGPGPLPAGAGLPRRRRKGARRGPAAPAPRSSSRRPAGIRLATAAARGGAPRSGQAAAPPARPGPARPARGPAWARCPAAISGRPPAPAGRLLKALSPPKQRRWRSALKPL